MQFIFVYVENNNITVIKVLKKRKYIMKKINEYIN